MAPRSGTVRFVLVSDDNSELWLSPSASPFSKKKIAWITGPGWFGSSPRGHTGRINSQWSAPIRVEKGQSYYVEAYHKEGAGDDHFELLWQFDEDEKPAEVPVDVLTPWMGSDEDADDDGLPDEWQRATGLAGRPDAAWWQDADGDGVSNFDEFIGHTDPMDDQPLNGFLLMEIWYGSWGREVQELRRDPRFSQTPHEALFIQGAAVPSLEASHFGSRLSGYLVPTESGKYELAVAGDDTVELWFSEDASKFNKKRVAFNDYWRGDAAEKEWSKIPSQRTPVLELEAGREYYFEVIHKDAVQPGWSALGWRMEGEKDFKAVLPQFLRSPAKDADDADGNGLPDSWVREMEAQAGAGAPFLTESGDPDGDGLSNLLEYQIGTDPYSRTSVPGALSREWWFRTPGVSLQRSREAGDLLRPPSMFTLTDGARSEMNTTDHFTSRIRGSVKAPVAGEYRFWIAGDDHCELWLSDSEQKFLKRKIAWILPSTWASPDADAWTEPEAWDERAAQKSGSNFLDEGEERFLEILHKDAGDKDHVAIAWQYRDSGGEWSEREVIPTEMLRSFPGDDDDLDDDYLPDSWEKDYGLDPQDNGSKDPVKQGENGDFDNDGLTNREEFLLGTNPCLADSDGDGVDDRAEVQVYGSDPTVKDASPPKVVTSLAPGGAVSGTMTWLPYVRDGAVYSLARRGQSNWEFEVSEPGIYQVDLAGNSISAEPHASPIAVTIKVDGVVVGEGDLTSTLTKLSFLTPWLSAGRHQITIVNRNVRSGVSMVIQSIEILAQTGEDANANGLPDWLERYYRDLNRVSVSEAGFETSPANLEGVSRFFEDLSITSGDRVVKATRGVGKGWFADVELDALGSPTTAKLSYEGGAITEEIDLVWKAINLLDGVDHRYIRRGDSVRLMACDPSGGADGWQFSLSLDGKSLHSGSSTLPFMHRFSKEGSYELATSAKGPAGEVLTSSVRFVVVDADLGADFHVPYDRSRAWTPSILPEAAVIQSDDNLLLSELPSDGKRSFDASFGIARETSSRVIARLPEGGAILDATNIHGFLFASATWTGDHQLIETLPDGTRVVRVGYVLDGEIPPDLSIWIEMYVPDAVFANGGSWLQLTADDFDENGAASFEIYKAPGNDTPYVCHWIRPFGDGPDERDESTSESTDAETPTGEAE
ncbi:PA14 domain-containing protein [Luteolibacter flavescens]|uniref:PA14 domain-containing protein n=1 Tax=Luteolibacter flavescens TaxID=1859460 RepID=A0ABT3FTW2_9BACT|nr:PA14 domain-containing protein [Luteolibacter flavescens]MCW1887023.1 PA14 domain-containing protein [Luteolibacter flavescens]